MDRTNTRRDFFKQTALAGVGFWVAGGIGLADDGPKSANQGLNFACIGVGGKGSSDTDQVGKHGKVVAICDIDDHMLERKAKKFPRAKKFNDFRRMLEKLEKNIDAVVVSTADHTHAVACMMAMKMKKHVYCQKPLTRTVHEARLLRETAAKMGVCTQMGNQGTASSALREAVEVIQAGSIGDVTEVHVWTNRPVWPQSPQVTKRLKPAACPRHIHWDLFLGPAPERPYAPGYHPFNWRGWWDFGTGALGDMACHTANMPFMALKLGYPSSVVAESGEVNPETFPAWARITFQFPARGSLPPVKLVWYEGKRNDEKILPPVELTNGLKMRDSGALLVGTRGMLYSPSDYGGSYVLHPEANFKDFKPPKRRLPRAAKGDIDEAMKIEWIGAIKSGKPETALSNFNYAALLTEAILLGNVALRVGKPLEWDGTGMKATNCPEADQYIKPEYRQGWSL